MFHISNQFDQDLSVHLLPLGSVAFKVACRFSRDQTLDADLLVNLTSYSRKDTSNMKLSTTFRNRLEASNGPVSGRIQFHCIG